MFMIFFHFLFTRFLFFFRSPDSALQSGLEKPKFTPSGPQLWKGFIQMQDVAKFVTTAYPVSGHADKLVMYYLMSGGFTTKYTWNSLGF